MKTQNTDWIFLFKHWFFTLLIGPIISQLLMYITVLHPNKIVSLLEVFPIALIFSLFFSIPTYVIYAFVYYYFSKKDFPFLFAKCILILIAVTGIFITSSLMRGFMWFDIAISYSVSSILIGLFFKLNFKSEEENVK
jgi:membrane protein YdbS with pleckstrin-like domain